ncbi:MAG: hypothetical protein L3K02_08045 [Thermoplasmata archaeon]|nr:hypothetical protein [Thermoplasmata archaeon]
MNAVSNSPSLSEPNSQPLTESLASHSTRSATRLDRPLSILAIVAVLLVASGAVAFPHEVGSGGTALVAPGTPSAHASPLTPLGPISALTRIGSQYLVNFTETGLPSNTSWTVNFSGQLSSSNHSSIGVSAGNGTWAWSASSPGYNATPANGTLTVAGSATGVIVTFTNWTYPVQFTENGTVLPIGTLWGVNAQGPGGSWQVENNGLSVSISLTNGSYNYTILVVGAPNFTAVPATGTFVVAGATLSFGVTFVATVSEYPITFVAIGLVNGTQWQVNMTGADGYGTILVSSNNETDLFLSNGSWVFTVVPVIGFTATYNSSVVIQGAGVTFTVVFTANSNSTPPPPTYVVTLVESGLPNGTLWSAALAGSGFSSTTNSMRFTEPNGTYSLTVALVANFTANYSSSVTVNGGAVLVGVAFSTSVYPITFVESGLPAESGWTVVTTNAVTQEMVSGQSTQRTITLQLGDGSYTITASGPLGYSVSLSTSVITVSGTSPVAITAAFTPSPVGITSLNTVPLLTTGILVVTAIVGVVGAGWGYTRYQYTQRRSRALSWVQEFRNDVADIEDQPP